MDITCPGCRAVYRIEPEALQATMGQARCSHCGKVFDASNAAPPDPAPTAPPEPAAPAAGPPEATAVPPSWEAAVPPLELVAGPALDLDATLAAPRRRRLRLVGQLVLALLLLALAAGQLLWIGRERLLASPAARELAERLCSGLPCTLAPRRDPTGFVVLQRQFEPLPDAPDRLALRVSFSNRSSFEQPLPRLQLSLFDNQQTLLARRTFQPYEYLDGSADPARPMAREEVITIDLRLADPGSHATGFELAFY